MARHVRPRVLRHRDDGHGRSAIRHRPVRHGAVLGDTPPGRPDDRRGPGQPEDGPGAAPGLRPDGRTEMGSRDGRLRVIGRHVQQLRGRAGRRPHRPRGHLPAGLPAAAGDAAERNPEAARQDPGDAAGRQPRRGHRRRRGGRARVADRPSNSRDCCGHDGTPTARRRTAPAMPRGDRHAARHVRRRGQRRHVRIRQAGPRGRAAGQFAAALRRVLRRRRRRADHRARRGRLRRRRRTRRGVPRRAHPRGAPRAPGRGRAGAARRRRR